MHEYEFRLVVEQSTPFTSFFNKMGYVTQQKIVYYVKPHFRYKDGNWETKRIQSIHSIYHDNVWFKWVHSIETPYKLWNRSMCENFLHQVGNFQNPLTVEIRNFCQIDSHAQLYTFQSDSKSYKLVFEWEYGTFKNPLKRFKTPHLFKSLRKYKTIYHAMSHYPTLPTFIWNERVIRKTVSCIASVKEGKQYLYAHKADGVFGFVYSYQDRIKEKWEGYECVIRKNVTLGEGFVFAAEKLESGEIILLDVYQVFGHDTHRWCRRQILLEFLPQLKLIEGYFVQKYFSNKNDLTSHIPFFKVDGVILHDVQRDVIFKYKTQHSIDLVYFKGYFQLHNGLIKSDRKDLEDGCVYEISTADGQIIRKRFDRFKGNSAKQLENILKFGWNGPPIEYTEKCNNKNNLEQKS